MRPRTDRKESSRSKPTVLKALERSSSATPEGAGGIDDRHLSDTAPLPQTTVPSNPKVWEEKSWLGHPQKTPRMTDRTSPGSEKKDRGKETDPLDASSTLNRSHRWTSDACWSVRSPDAADGRTSRAQQRKQEEDHSPQQEPQSQHKV